MQGDARETGLRQNKASSGRHEPPLPGIHPGSHNCHHWLEVCDGELLVTDREAQVLEGELPFLTVEQMSHPGLLMAIHTHHNDLTLVIIDLETREELKANQQKLQVSDAVIIILYQDHCVIYILKMCHPTWQQVRNQSFNVTSHIGLF
jgi:hypothetical protein